VEGDQIRDADLPCGAHGEQWHWVIDALAMHKVPSALPDHSRNPGGKVIISLAGPGRDTHDWDALNRLFSWQLPGPVGCEHGDFETPQRGQATGNLIDVCLNPAEFRKVTWADHEYAQWPFQRPALLVADRLVGTYVLVRSYVAYNDLSVSRPSLLVRYCLRRSCRISRCDPRVNGFEALSDCGCCEPPDALLCTSSEAGA
jgi:hypothetical protein